MQALDLFPEVCGQFAASPLPPSANAVTLPAMQDVLASLFQHAAMTAGMTVRVAVTYMPEQSRVTARRWFWVYHIRIENHRDDTVQLLTRHWRITDSRGMVNIVDGEGVVGETPVLAPGATHDYVSGCELTSNMGSMEGHYTFAREDGSRFEVAIPFFPLAAPDTQD
jgi:ApaG protein